MLFEELKEFKKKEPGSRIQEPGGARLNVPPPVNVISNQ
jgi:hypothetical protein